VLRGVLGLMLEEVRGVDCTKLYNEELHYCTVCWVL
jgi:hypothetical protein